MKFNTSEMGRYDRWMKCDEQYIRYDKDKI